VRRFSSKSHPLYLAHVLSWFRNILSGVVPSNFSSVYHFLKCLLFLCFSLPLFFFLDSPLDDSSSLTEFGVSSLSVSSLFFLALSGRSSPLLSSVAYSNLRRFFILSLSLHVLSFTTFFDFLISPSVSLLLCIFLLFTLFSLSWLVHFVQNFLFFSARFSRRRRFANFLCAF